MSASAAAAPPGEAGEVQKVLARLLAEARFAVLATQRGGQPYANLIAFAAGEDLSTLVFVTPRATRKYENLRRDPRVAVLVADSRNSPADLAVAAAATGIGEARELEEGARDEALARLLARHPALAEFVRAPTCAAFAVRIRRYVLVRRFQEVTEVCFDG